MNTKPSRAVSPTVAVILFVLVTVALSLGVYMTVDGMVSDNAEPSQTSMQIESGGGDYRITILTGDGDGTVTYLVNGNPVYGILSPTVGASTDLEEYTQLCSGDHVTIIESYSGRTTQVQSSTIPQNVSCPLPETEVATNASYNGSSWIVSVTLSNNGNQTKQYALLLSDGSKYTSPKTVAVDPGETKTLTPTLQTNKSDTPPETVIVGPPDSDSVQLSMNSEDDIIYTGGPSSSAWIYPPYTGGEYSLDSSNSGSRFETEDGSESPDVELSKTRVSPGEEVYLYANLTTSKETAEENLIIYALSSDGSQLVVSNTTHTLEKGEYTAVEVPFSIATAGDYVITTSLSSSDTVVKVGPLRVTDGPEIAVSDSFLSPSDPLGLAII